MQSVIPTPSRSAVGLGPFTIHFYALCILVGVIVAIAIGRKRYAMLGGDPDEVLDIAIYAIPAGIIGGRIYHVVTSPEIYFGAHGHPLNALKIWDGGLGIWGAIALGTALSYLAFKRSERSLSFANFLDALTPGILVAQGLGRWGNWFNGELFGRPTKAPWGLEIPLTRRPVGYESFATFHPTFLYESIWCFFAAVLVILIAKRWLVAPGNLFLLYIAIYCIGRSWIEYLRIDSAHQILGIRLNDWVSGIGLLVSIFTFVKREKTNRAGILRVPPSN